jgi:hypothetical protein
MNQTVTVRNMFDQAQVLPVIVERLSQGEPLEQICRDQGMPTSRTVRLWEEQSPTISSEVARARACGYDAIAADCLRIADSGSPDRDQRDKLRIETRLKLLACWDPKRFGAKVQLDADVRMQVELVDATAVQATATLITKEDPSTER